MKQNPTELKGEIDNLIVTFRNFNIVLSIFNRTTIFFKKSMVNINLPCNPANHS